MHTIKSVQFFLKHPEGVIPHVDVSPDLNQDGGDEVVLPNAEGLTIHTLTSGEPARQVAKLGPIDLFDGTSDDPENGWNLKVLPWYMHRIHILDDPANDRPHLVFLNQGAVNVFAWNEKGQLSPANEKINSELKVESDVFPARLAEQEDHPFWGQFLGFKSRTRWTSLFAVEDINADGIPDLITQTLEGRSLIRLKTHLQFHFGKKKNGQIHYSAEPDTAIQQSGRQPLEYAMQQLVDLNGDGLMEVGLVGVDAGVEDMFEALVASSIDLNLEIHRLEKGTFSKKPALKRKIQPDTKWFDKQGPFFPALVAGDVNGDGYVDLLTGHSRHELRVYPGIPGRACFAVSSQGFKVDLPANEQFVRLVDLDQDDKEDVLIFRPSGSQSHSITVMLGR